MISNTLFSGIADRMAAFAGLMKYYINSGVNNGTPMYKRIHTQVPTDGDFSVENDLISAAHGVDVNTVSGAMFRNVYSSFISALEAHVLDNDAASFDLWMDTSGINVHPDFDDIWYQVKGSHLNGVNVFYPIDNVILASAFPTASGTNVFTQGTTLGTGTGAFSTSNYAAEKLVLVPVGDVGSETVLNLRLTRESGQSGGSTADSCNIRVPNGTASGTQFPINWSLSGVNANNQYLSCSNIIALGGTSGNGFRVIGIKERDIRL